MRSLVQILEEDRERLRTLVLEIEEKPTGRNPSVRSLSPVKDDEIYPFRGKSYEEDSYTLATPFDEKLVGEAMGIFSSPT
jgi:hypothetical protein